MDNTYFSFGKALAQRRIRLSISREELAKKAGISLSMLSKIERDETNPTILVASSLARSLNTTVSELLGERPEEVQHVGNIEEYIENLRRTDEQLTKIIAKRKELEPDFYANFPCTYIFDTNIRYLFASNYGAKTIGKLPHEVVGKHWSELGLPANAMEEIERNIRTVLSTGKPLTAEATFSGPYALDYLDYRLNPLFNARGCIVAVMGTVRTITQRKLAEHELKKQVHKLRHLLNVCPLGIITIDQHGAITAVNKYAQTLIATHISENWIGKDIKQLIEIAGLNYEQAPLIRALRGEEIPSEYIDGNGKSWGVSASPLTDATGTVDGAIAFFHLVQEAEVKQ